MKETPLWGRGKGALCNNKQRYLRVRYEGGKGKGPAATAGIDLRVRYGGGKGKGPAAAAGIDLRVRYGGERVKGQQRLQASTYGCVLKSLPTSEEVSRYQRLPF